MKRIVVDAALCAGCRYCEMLCSFHHEGRFSPSLSRVAVVKEDRHGMDYPVFCRQCDNCPPLESCPTGALSKTGLGVVAVDRDACTGCSSCIEACTFKAIQLDKSAKPLICDLCGGKPICVERCPAEALRYEESEEIMERPEDIFRELKRRWGIGG